ncbi:MAG: hypothetical protein ACH349_01365 [Candidatus Rhabdochlamydia sp.]
MSDPGLCCDECFNLLAKRSVDAACLWLDLCEIQKSCKVFGLKVEDDPYFQLLECLGFITTTDALSLIIVKVHGREEDGLGAFFCGGKCGRE